MHFSCKLHILLLSLLAGSGVGVGCELLDKVRLLKVIRSLNLLGVNLSLSFGRLGLPRTYNWLDQRGIALGVLLRLVSLRVGVVG